MTKKIIALTTGLTMMLSAAPAFAANGCEIVTTTVVSDTTNTVQGGGNAVAVTYIHPAWTASIPGATWIWSVDPVANPTIDEFATFEKGFNLAGNLISATLDIASDNSYEVWVNGTPVGSDGSENNFQLGTQDQYTAPILGALLNGANLIEVAVHNWDQAGGTPTSNPAGLLYKLVVEMEVCENNVTVTNSNNADVHNVVISSASTGGNYAGGSAGGDGGNGGSIRNSGGSQNVDDSATGSGGTGGNGGLGGTIYTGNAGASASATNVVNVNDVTIDRCACAGGDNGNDTVVNGNNAEVGNFVLAKAKTGWNRAEGSSGGDGGRGGKISNSGGLILVEQDEENGYSSQNVDDTTTGAGGNGGTGGNGGLVRTGNAGSVSAVVNTTNVSVVRIRR